MLAMDPRIPDDLEAFEFILDGFDEAHRIDWYVDGRLVQTGTNDTYLWQLKRGEHVAWARVWRRPEGPGELAPAVNFIVR
jgi:penicillin-binding protein 1C